MLRPYRGQRLLSLITISFCKVFRRCSASFAALLLCTGLAATALAADPVPEVDARTLVQLGPGDQISMSVYDQADLSTTVYVGDDGSANLPLVGTVQVSGLSPVEAGVRVEEKLKSGGFLRNPHVNITLVQSRSQRVAVLGEVSHPGRFTVEPNTNIFDLLAQAGGVSTEAAEYAYILRPDGHGDVTRLTVQLGGFSANRDTKVSETLRGGDTLFVPRSRRFYIYGEVTQPNQYRLEPNMTVLQAIARAGGITLRGTDRRIEIKRADKDGHYTIIHAKLSDLIQPDDVIRIKESIF